MATIGQSTETVGVVTILAGMTLGFVVGTIPAMALDILVVAGIFIGLVGWIIRTRERKLEKKAGA
jgi:hypothetical protein